MQNPRMLKVRIKLGLSHHTTTLTHVSNSKSLSFSRVTEININNIRFLKFFTSNKIECFFPILCCYSKKISEYYINIEYYILIHKSCINIVNVFN